jgi:hypothetical protein
MLPSALIYTVPVHSAFVDLKLNDNDNIAINNSINIVPETDLFMPSPLNICLRIELKIFHTMVIEEFSNWLFHYVGVYGYDWMYVDVCVFSME